MLINCRRDQSGRGGVADQVRERGYRVLTGHPIVQVFPEGETVFQAGLLEAEEGVATSSSVLAAGAGADLAFLHHVPDVILAAVVVQR